MRGETAHEWAPGKCNGKGKKQIPFGNDNKNGKGNGKGNAGVVV